jgi:hypothetical protein
MYLIEVSSSIVTPFPSPMIRTDVAEWLREAITEGWRLVHEGPPWAEYAIAFQDDADAALFRISWP